MPIAGRFRQTEHPRAAYVHIPFCVSKCHYCDFNSYPGLDVLFEDYVQAVITEIRRTGSKPVECLIPPGILPGGDRPELDSVFIGGGTPTVLPPASLILILAQLRDTFGLARDAEITFEANPGTIDEPKLAQLREGGYNRISIGVQSFDDDFLRKIGRVHTARQAIDAIGSARLAGFDSISLDLIFSLPGQSVSHWAKTLESATALRPEHISAYELTVEEGTQFAALCSDGSLELPSEDEQIEMYELTAGLLASGGYEHYEVSNYALPDFRCRHNLVYWRNEPYLGFGSGATSYVGGVRAKRLSAPADYIEAVRDSRDIDESSECLAGKALLAETVIQGLRLLEGIDLAGFRERTGVDLSDEFEAEIKRLHDLGLVEIDRYSLKVTKQGLMLLNDVAAEFLSV